MHVAQRPKIVAISPFSLQYQGNATNLGSLGKESGRHIYVSGNSLSHRIVFSWDNAGLLQRRSALQCVVEATTMVVAITRARVAIVVFFCNNIGSMQSSTSTMEYFGCNSIYCNDI